MAKELNMAGESGCIGKMPCIVCGKYEGSMPVSLRKDAVAFLMKFRKGFNDWYCDRCFYEKMRINK